MIIQHYGVKGMKWGVSKYSSKASKAGAVVRKAMVGDEARSLATARGRKNFVPNIKKDTATGKKAVSKLLKNKTFKALIYNHENAKKLVSMGKQQAKDVLALVKKDD